MATELLMRASALYGAASMAAFLLGKVCERQTESALEGARHALGPREVAFYNFVEKRGRRSGASRPGHSARG